MDLSYQGLNGGRALENFKTKCVVDLFAIGKGVCRTCLWVEPRVFVICGPDSSQLVFIRWGTEKKQIHGKHRLLRMSIIHPRRADQHVPTGRSGRCGSGGGVGLHFLGASVATHQTNGRQYQHNIMGLVIPECAWRGSCLYRLAKHKQCAVLIAGLRKWLSIEAGIPDHLLPTCLLSKV